MYSQATTSCTKLTLLVQPVRDAQNSSSWWKNMVKLMIVPYMSSPPTMLITIASGRIRSQCASTTGNAVADYQ